MADLDELNAPYLQEKIQEYTKFYEGKLLPELKFAQNAERETIREISDYQDLKVRLLQSTAEEEEDGKLTAAAGLPKEFERVDLAGGRVFCRALVEDTSKLYVNVGMGFHVELTVDEALSFVDRRVRMLESSVLPRRSATSRRVKDHAQSTERILQELDRELQRIGH